MKFIYVELGLVLDIDFARFDLSCQGLVRLISCLLGIQVLDNKFSLYCINLKGLLR